MHSDERIFIDYAIFEFFLHQIIMKLFLKLKFVLLLLLLLYHKKQMKFFVFCGNFYI